MAPTRKPRKRAPQRDPEYIPRPANAWILYRTDRLREMVEEGEKDVKQSNASKLIGKMWHHEKPEVRAMYEKRAELGRLEHARKHPGYKYRPRTKAFKQALREKAQEEQKRAREAKKAQQAAARHASSSRRRASRPLTQAPMGNIDRGCGPSPPIDSDADSPLAYASSGNVPLPVPVPVPHPTAPRTMSTQSSNPAQPYLPNETAFFVPPPSGGHLPAANSWMVNSAPQENESQPPIAVDADPYGLQSLLNEIRWDFPLDADQGSPFGAPATPGEAEFGTFPSQQPPVAGLFPVPQVTPNEDDGLASAIDMEELQEYIESTATGSVDAMNPSFPLSYEDILLFQEAFPDQAQMVLNTGEFYRVEGSAVAHAFPHMTYPVQREPPYVLDPQPDRVSSQDWDTWLANNGANFSSQPQQHPTLPGPVAGSSSAPPPSDPSVFNFAEQFVLGDFTSSESTPSLSGPSPDPLAGPSTGPTTPTYGYIGQFALEQSGMQTSATADIQAPYQNFLFHQQGFQQSSTFGPPPFEQPAPEQTSRTHRYVPPGGAGQAGRRRVGARFKKGPPLFPGFTDDSGSGSA